MAKATSTAMFQQMIVIAGGILLALFVLVNMRLIINTLLVLAGAFALFVLYLRLEDEPSYLPSKETFGAIFSILLLIGLVFFAYNFYKEFMKGWRGDSHGSE